MNKTSIVVTCIGQSVALMHMTSRMLCDLRMYTDPEEYELIIIDNKPTDKNMKHYKICDMGCGGGWYKNVLCQDINTPDNSVRYIINEIDIGYDASMNQGAKLANYEYICFIENDIFLHEGWLRDLRYYLDNNLTDIITPVQMPMTREEYLGTLKKTYEEALHPGWQEQGLLMLRKDMFNKIGGWDDRFKMVYGWKAFEYRLRKVGARVHNTEKVYITHLAAQTILDSEDRKPEEYYKVKDMEANIIL